MLLGADYSDYDFNQFHHVPPSLHEEAESIHQRVPKYFQRLVESDPRVTGAGELTSRWDGERTESLCKEVYRSGMRLLEYNLSDTLSTRLWVVAHYFVGGVHSAVFAAYDDGLLLWLDNHIDNQDFDRFWQRENIVWESADEAAAFMMTTKFHYLLGPYVVSDVADIPQQKYREFLRDHLKTGESSTHGAFSEENMGKNATRMRISRLFSRVKERFRKPLKLPLITHDYAEYLRKYEQDLADVAPHIHPPSLDTVQGTTHLRFCVWLAVRGQLLRIQCRFDPKGKLSYQGETLGTGIGDLVILR